MRKQFVGLLAAGVLMSGLSAVPLSVSAASSSTGKAVANSYLNGNNAWRDWTSFWGNARNQPSDKPANDPNASSNKDRTDNAAKDSDAASMSDPSAASDDIEKVISDGMKYLGTPYEFGSDRSTKTTFDCSDFVRWIFDETLGVKLPSDSRQQGAYVKERAAGTVQTDWHRLKRGDLMFFMSYKGANASDYANANKKTERITHVGVYLGNGRILHTYSKNSGGVRTDNFEGTAWEHRFLFGGSAV